MLLTLTQKQVKLLEHQRQRKFFSGGRMETIIVNLGEKSYPINISTNGWNDLRNVIPEKYKMRTVMVVSDENVHPVYFENMRHLLESFGSRVFSAVITAGESSKSLNVYENLITKALQYGLNRKSAIIALGGGVAGDLAGFVASTYMRGIDFIQIPTSLLSMVDSSVGGKVAVNHPLAKNIIGAFYQPEFVYINVRTLATLPVREFSSGMAELIKHGFIYDNVFLQSLDDNMDKLMSLDLSALAEAIATSCRIKAGIVEQDEKETGIRAILNFGHTVGHAIEAVAGYDKYTHGEAVSIGMIYESLIAKEMGLVDDVYIERLRSILKRAMLPTEIKDIDTGKLIERMSYDKKNQDKGITFVLPTDYGKVEIFKDIGNDLIKRVLN